MINNGTVPAFFKDLAKGQVLFPNLVFDQKLLGELQSGSTTIKRVKLADPGNVLYTLYDAATGEPRK